MIGMYSFRLLKAVAAVVSFVIILWSLGFTTVPLVGAATISEVSNTLTDTDPSAVSDHTIVFTTPTGINTGETITIDFSDGQFTGTSTIVAAGIDVQDGVTDLSVSADCTVGTDEVGVSFTGYVLEIEFCPGDGASIAAGGTTTIEIGKNADPGSDQLINPGTPGSYSILIGGTQADSGSTKVVIIENVDVTARVDTIFTFTVNGVGPGTVVNGATTTGSTTATAITFGTLVPNVASTTAQNLTVTTNSTQGYVVTVEQSSEFMSSTNAVIDGFRNGDWDTVPVTWEGPTPVLGDITSYGHWGITSDDATTTRANEFSDNAWVSASTSPIVIMSHDGAANAINTGEGTTNVGYRVEISGLQEAGSDYQTSLTYIATPIF